MLAHILTQYPMTLLSVYDYIQTAYYLLIVNTADVGFRDGNNSYLGLGGLGIYVGKNYFFPEKRKVKCVEN